MLNPLKTMQVIHGALFLGILLFGAVAYFIAEVPTESVDNSMFTYVWLGLTIPALVAVFYFYNNRRSAWEHLSSQGAKEQAYQTRMILIYALIEGPSLFGIVLYVLSADLMYLTAVAIFLLIFIRLRPTAQSFQGDLGI
jgi:protein-S-isoprenylcysteine O-methyltransferase Ste14